MSKPNKQGFSTSGNNSSLLISITIEYEKKFVTTQVD